MTRAALLARDPLRSEPDYHLVRALVGQWLAKQIALDRVATELPHALEILGGLDALRGDRHPEAFRELDDRLDDRDVFGPGARLTDEAAVDLQLVEDRLVQIADRRIAGAEVVERDADAERAQPLHDVQRRSVVAQEDAFGDFELDPVPRHLPPRKGLAHEVRQRSHDDLLRADVQREGDRIRPGRDGAAGLVDDPFADHRHETALFRDRDEDVRRDEAALRVIPADQGLEADQLLSLRADQRLENEVELLRGDRLAEVGFEPDAILLLRLEFRREVAGHSATGILRFVKREVGLQDQVVDSGAVDGTEGAADRDADADFGLVDHVGFFDRHDDPVGELLDHLAALRVGDDDRELVAAHAADVTVLADLVDEALGDGAKHRVPLRVAERIVDRLEPVEVEEEDRAGHARDGRVAQGIAEQLAHAAAVRKARQHVHVGEVGQPLLRLGHLGDVAADAAEAFEAAGGVDDRITRDRDPSRAARRLKLHVERIERLLFEKLATELGIAAQERG